MPATCPNEGEREIANYIRIYGTPNWRMKLFANDYQPTEFSTLLDFQEAMFSGYAEQTPVYAAPAIDGNGDAAMAAAELTFVHNGGGIGLTVYGWYIMDNVSNVLIQAERLSAAKAMISLGDSIAITHTHVVGNLAVV